MKELFQHKATNSVLLWMDNYLLDKGEAFHNEEGLFYNYTDERLGSSLITFGSPHKQWVTDSSIAGATIPSGVFIDGSFSGRDDGVILDFDNGRALLDSADTESVVTGQFSVKDFSIYYSNDSEEDLIVEKKYIENPRFSMGIRKHIEPYDFAVPAIFVNNETMKNEGFAFGGLEETTLRFTAVVVAADLFQLEGALSIFADSKNEVIPVIPMTGHPSTEYGDIKNGSYSYSALRAEYLPSGTLFVNSVVTSKLTEQARKDLHTHLYMGVIDFEIQQHRNRHT